MLDSFGIFVGDRDHFIARAAFGGRQRREHERIGLAKRFHRFRRPGIAHHDGFHLCDAPVIDLHPQCERDRIVVLAQCTQKPHLACLRIADHQFVCADSVSCAPDAFAERNRLFVFGELDLGRERQTVRIARDHRIEILVDEAFQTHSITRPSGFRRLSLQRHGRERENPGTKSHIA